MGGISINITVKDSWVSSEKVGNSFISMFAITSFITCKIAKNGFCEDAYPTVLSEQQAKALHVNVGSMGLYICRTNCDQNGVITDVDQEYWLHDVLDLHFEAS